LNARQQLLEIQGDISLVNPNGQQLTVQEIGVPAVLFWASALFGGSAAALLLLLVTVLRRARTTIHLVMVVAMFLKASALLLQWYDRDQVARTGDDSAVGVVGWQLVEKVQGIVELMMFLLIALGWKLLRNTLNVTEVRFAVGISVISLYLGVLEVSCTTAPTCSGYLAGYQLSRYVLHSLCCLVVIVAMNFNLHMIHSQLVDTPATLEAGKLYTKLHAYKAFRWLFLYFIVSPTAELFLKASVMPWDAMWIFVLLQQVRSWVLYAGVAFYFQPDRGPFRVFDLTRHAGSDDEDDDAEIAAD